MRSGAGHQVRFFAMQNRGIGRGSRIGRRTGMVLRGYSSLPAGPFPSRDRTRGPVRLAPPSLSEQPCPVHSSAESIYWYTEIRPRCCTAQSRTWSRGCQFSRHRRIASLQRFCSKFPWTCVDLLVAAQVRWTIRQLQQRNGAPLCARLATPRSRFIPTTES